MEKDVMLVNLWDESFRHLTNESGRYSMIHEKKPNNISWVRDRLEYDGITIFTDMHLNPNSISRVKSRQKIGWFLENRSVVRNAYLNVDSYINMLDFIFTNDYDLLTRYPEKARFVPFGGGWVKHENFGIHPKNKLVSMIYSNKKQFEGHRLRHEIADRYSDKIDLFGHGSPKPIKSKEEALTDYMYTIVIENISDRNYFTEKIVDPMLLGTIPVYWGCPNIEDFFKEDGMLTFKTIDDFDNIFNTLDKKLYKSMEVGVGLNYRNAMEYEITEDWFYKNILNKL
jgi:hypothetical protein